MRRRTTARLVGGQITDHSEAIPVQKSPSSKFVVA